LTPEIERDALAFLATWRPGWRTGATPGEVYRWHVRCGRKATATRGLLGISQRTLQNYVRDIEKALTTELGRKVDLSRFRKAKRQPVTRQIQKVYLSPDRKTTDRTARNPAGIAPQSDSATYATWRENMNEELKSRDDERDE
jgi:hypothetical protein